MMNSSIRERIKNMVLIALFAVIIAVCAWVHVPTMPIPYSMQNFGVFIAIGILGGKRAFFSIAVYLGIGALGLPVFTGFTGGLGRLFGETGGFLLGFLAIALISWLITAFFKKGTPSVFLSMLIGQLASYAIGVFWYWFFYAKGGSATSFFGILAMCVLPFLIPDIIKISVATVISDRVKRILKI